MDFKETVSEEAFYKRVYKKSNSRDSEIQARAAVSNIKHYCKDEFDEDEKTVLTSLKKQDSVGALFVFLNDFIDWMGDDHPNILYRRNKLQKNPSFLRKKKATTIIPYMYVLKKFLKLCYGIRADPDDWKTELELPLKEEIEPEPITPEELRAILDAIPDPQRKTMTMAGKDTGFRILELLKTKREHIDFTKDPVEIKLPNKLMKGKRGGRTAYITSETRPRLALLCKSLEPGQYVFHNNSDIYSARNNFEEWWNRLVKKKCGFTEKYENGRLKKNFHSVRAFCATQYSDAPQHSSDDGHGYIGHKAYLAQYIRQSDEKKINKFKRAESYLSVYDRTIVVKQTKEEMVKEVMEDPLVINAISATTKASLNNVSIQEMIDKAVALALKNQKERTSPTISV